jgi:hypothetical protein
MTSCQTRSVENPDLPDRAWAAWAAATGAAANTEAAFVMNPQIVSGRCRNSAQSLPLFRINKVRLRPLSRFIL